MQKHILSLLCALGLSISAPTFAQVKLKSGAPQSYTVKQGDTLWGISKKFLQKPWEWPELWGANKNQIGNPNRIYPGQTLTLDYVNGQPRLSVKQSGGIPVIKLTPQVREVSSGYGISTIDVDFYRMFMNYPQVLPIKTTLDAPKLIAGPEHRFLYNKGDRVYTYGLTKPGKYYTYRFNKDILDPDTNKLLGREIIVSGIVSTLNSTSTALDNRSEQEQAELPDDEYYTKLHPLIKVPSYSAQPLIIEESISEIGEGDFLLPIEEGNNNSMAIMPHAPEKPVLAKVVSIIDGISESGPLQTITLNQGLSHGIDEGTVLSLYKKSRKIKPGVNIKRNRDGETNSVVTMKYLSIPAEEVALAMVYRTYDNISYAIILEGKLNVGVGDYARNPGFDLDDFAIDSKHAPNDAVEPSGWHSNQYNSTDPSLHENYKVNEKKKL